MPPKNLKLLFADDEKSLQDLMRLELPRMGHDVTVCPDGLTACEALEQTTFDCILVDLDMPGRSGIDVITRAKELSPDTDAIILTGKSSLDSAVAALRQGAFDYLTKPCKLFDLQTVLQRVADKRELRNKYRAAKRQLERLEGPANLVGQSLLMEQVRQLTMKVAPTKSAVLIRGETGTGKELVARALHDQSRRSDMPLVAINCGALPETLIESELFGHRKGSFTGADTHRIGLFEVANGGTLFLDEIGELPKAMQAKLLRVLENGEIRPVGGNEAIRVDVRLVCATHRNLDHMVRDGEFREDLMFRVNTFEIQLPPLRERQEDIIPLAAYLFTRFTGREIAEEELFTSEATELLTEHRWPGNVRELANAIEHATILCETPPIAPEHLPGKLVQHHGQPARVSSQGVMTLRELEMQAIYQALERNKGSKPKAAEELGVSLKTLYNKLNQAEITAKSA